ncbi:MAG: type II toxin-antitoxin system HicB family antitoxin [Deinococcota bacterium]|jgi:antitoxin HicB|nr:type II toxin-antitoxin system HicB family antitoxin [Deinococcota bacterium]
MKYPFVIEKAPRNYAGFFPDIPGVATAKTKEELKERMAEVLALTLDELRASAAAIPAPTPLDKLDVSEYEPEEPFEIAEVEPAPMNPVSLEIERAIRAAGLSESEVARRIGTSRAAMTRITNPFYWGHSLSTLHKLADALGAQLEVSLRPRAA